MNPTFYQSKLPIFVNFFSGSGADVTHEPAQMEPQAKGLMDIRNWAPSPIISRVIVGFWLITPLIRVITWL